MIKVVNKKEHVLSIIISSCNTCLTYFKNHKSILFSNKAKYNKNWNYFGEMILIFNK